MSEHEVAMIAKAVETMEGQGMVVHRALPNTGFRMVDPFLLLDMMGPKRFGPGEGRGAPDHPHRGFETVTYVLDGRLQHKDSQGNVGDLNTGDVQWMTAGAGVVHSEMPHPDLQQTGGTMHGLQLWVNLPAADKMMQPRYQDIASAAIPEVAVEGGNVRVIAGRFQDTQAVIDTRTPITYLHAVLGPGGHTRLPVPEGHNAFAFAIDGSGLVAGVPQGARQIQLVRGEVGDPVENPLGMVRTPGAAGHHDGAPDGTIDVFAGDAGLSIILVTGKPLGEPVAQWGPFVMNDRAGIVQAIKDYQEGRMGAIEPTIG